MRPYFDKVLNNNNAEEKSMFAVETWEKTGLSLMLKQLKGSIDAVFKCQEVQSVEFHFIFVLPQTAADSSLHHLSC